MYATVADLRAEGVTVTLADDARLTLLIEEASALIDQLTGWWFEPRALLLRMDGRGTPTIVPPAPPIRLDHLFVGGDELPTAPEYLVVVGAPVLPGLDGPRITQRWGVFLRGDGNVLADGLWGYTEPDGTPEGRTPLPIRRATMLLVLRHVYPLADDAAVAARTRWRVVEERTRDQSYKLGTAPEPAHGMAGDPDIDALLSPYMRPSHFGVA